MGPLILLALTFFTPSSSSALQPREYLEGVESNTYQIRGLKFVESKDVMFCLGN